MGTTNLRREGEDVRIAASPVYLGVNTDLSVLQRTVVLTAGGLTINLPPVGEMAGRIVSIYTEANSTSDSTVADPHGSIDWTNITLAGNGTDQGFVTLYSDGRRWCILEQNAGTTGV